MQGFTNLKTTQSRRSRSGTTNTRPRSGTANSTSRPNGLSLQRTFSAQFIDDHSTYHHDHDYPSSSEDEEEVVDTDSTAAVSTPSGSSRKSDFEDVNLEKDLEKGKVGDDDEKEEIPEVAEGIPTEIDRDVVKREMSKDAGGRQLEKRKSRKERDPNIVTWDGPDDPENPKNWTIKKKWAATLVVSSFTFISPVSSSMIAPAVGSITREFGITSSVEAQLTFSIFVLAYAIGPLFLGPLSEVYGRVPVLQLANLFYLIFNTACGGSKSKGQMIAFRFLSGLGGSAPLALGGGVLSDTWLPEQRGKSISIYSLAPLLGPAIGPIAGGFIVQSGLGWRWIFYIVSIADAVIQLVGLFFLKETYAPKLLSLKAKKLRKETGNTHLHTEYEKDGSRDIGNVLKKALIRPFKLLGTQPIVQFLAVYMAFLYGMMYLMLSTFPGLWEGRYGESIGIGGLNYISLGLGFFLGTQITAPINDRIYVTLKKRNNNIGKPEFRVPLMPIGALLVPTGLFIYGWTAQAHTHWIAPNIGACLFAAGCIIGFQSIQTYLVDTYTRFAASAIAAVTVLRSLAGFGFPLFAPAMYQALDYGVGTTILAVVGIVVGIPGPIVLWKYGEKLREKSQFAQG